MSWVSTSIGPAATVAVAASVALSGKSDSATAAALVEVVEEPVALATIARGSHGAGARAAVAKLAASGGDLPAGDAERNRALLAVAGDAAADRAVREVAVAALPGPALERACLRDEDGFVIEVAARMASEPGPGTARSWPVNARTKAAALQALASARSQAIRYDRGLGNAWGEPSAAGAAVRSALLHQGPLRGDILLAALEAWLIELRWDAAGCGRGDAVTSWERLVRDEEEAGELGQALSMIADAVASLHETDPDGIEGLLATCPVPLVTIERMLDQLPAPLHDRFAEQATAWLTVRSAYPEKGRSTGAGTPGQASGGSHAGTVIEDEVLAAIRVLQRCASLYPERRTAARDQLAAYEAGTLVWQHNSWCSSEAESLLNSLRHSYPDPREPSQWWATASAADIEQQLGPTSGPLTEAEVSVCVARPELSALVRARVVGSYVCGQLIPTTSAHPGPRTVEDLLEGDADVSVRTRSALESWRDCDPDPHLWGAVLGYLPTLAESATTEELVCWLRASRAATSPAVPEFRMPAAVIADSGRLRALIEELSIEEIAAVAVNCPAVGVAVEERLSALLRESPTALALVVRLCSREPQLLLRDVVSASQSVEC